MSSRVSRPCRIQETYTRKLRGSSQSSNHRILVVSTISRIKQLRQDLFDIVRAALESADAGRLLARTLENQTILGQLGTRRVRVVAAGKVSAVMAETFARVLPVSPVGGLVASADRAANVPEGLDLYVAGHPLPDTQSVAAGRRALEMAMAVRRDEALVVLLSGGASALLALPWRGLDLNDKIDAVRALLAGGVEIHSVNAVRKHLSAIKGGRLAAAVRGTTVTLALSDVVGPVEDDPSVIGSGPTRPDPSTFADALAIAQRDEVRHAFPPKVTALLQCGARGEIPETPKHGDPSLARSFFHLVGSRRDALAGAAVMARERGYDVVTLSSPITGEARLAAGYYEAAAHSVALVGKRPLCVLSAGETTVRVTGHGRGGRSQEFALAMTRRIEVFGDCVALASIGTDGIDGSTDAAGAIVDRTTLERAAEIGLGLPERYLEDNDSNTFFTALGDLVETGPTRTNVGDLQVLLVA